MRRKTKYGYIYLTENLINGKKYLGQHRAKGLESKYLGSGKQLLRAIRKYGRENFKCSIVEWCYSEKELNEREIYWIDYYDAVNNSSFYNLAPGGGGNTYGAKPQYYTSEIKLKISQKAKNHRVTHKNAVICLESGEIFPSECDASKSVSSRIDSLGYSLIHHTPYKGKHYMYLEDYKKLSSSEIEEIISLKKFVGSSKRVQNLNTGEIYDSASSVENKYSGHKTGNISTSIRSETKAYGYYWAYINGGIPYSIEERKIMLKTKELNKW